MVISVNQEFYKRKRIVQISVAVIGTLFLIFLFIPLAKAGIKGDIAQALSKVILDLGQLQGWVVKAIFTSELWNFFGGETTNVGQLGGTFFSNIGVAMRTIAAGLLTIKLLMETINAASKNEANLDFVLKMGVKLSTMLILVLNIDTVLTAFHDFFRWVVNEVTSLGAQTLSETGAQAVQKIADSIDGSWLKVGFIALLVIMFLSKAVMQILLLILDLLVCIGSYSIMLELGVRRLFMPVALLGFLDNSPTSSPGARYLKKYVAVYIKIMIYLLAFLMADALYIATLEHLVAPEKGTDIVGWIFGTLGLDYLALYISAYAFAKKGENLATEVVGA